MPLRPAAADDAAAIAALWTEAYTGRGPEEGRSAPYSVSDYAAAARHGRLSVAEENGALLGVVAFYPAGAPGRAIGAAGEAELSRLAVAASARGRGIGRALAEHCTAQARASGAAAIVLWSRPYQVEAHRLYESLGYHRAPDRDDEDGEGGRRVFVLELRPGES